MGYCGFRLRHVGLTSLFLLILPIFGADKNDLPSPQQLLDAASKLTDLSSLYPYQISARVTINRGTKIEKSGVVTIYREKTDYRYELQVEDYGEVVMRKGDRFYTWYSAFPAPELGTLRSIGKWPKELVANAVTGRASKKKIGNTDVWCIDLKSPRNWRSRACFDHAKAVLLEVSDKHQKESFLDYQSIDEQQFPGKIRIVRPGLGQNIELDIHIQKISPGPATMEVPKGAHEFETCDDKQPPELVSEIFSNPRLIPIYSGKPIVAYFYAVIDKKGEMHDLAVYSPTGRANEKEWKEMAQAWRFKPATCNGRPVISEWQLSLETGVD